MPLAPIAAVEYFAAAPAFASDHGLGMAIAQFDLSNVTASAIDLLRNQGRALTASGLFTS